MKPGGRPQVTRTCLSEDGSTSRPTTGPGGPEGRGGGEKRKEGRKEDKCMNEGRWRGTETRIK